MVATNANTNLPSGITNVADATKETLGGYPAPDPTRLHTWFNDFDKFATTTDWLDTVVGSSTAVVGNTDGGVVVLTTGASDNDGIMLQWSGDGGTTVSETFKWAANRDMFFKTRLAVSEATQSDWIVGLQTADTTPFDATDGLYFVKVDGATAVNFKAVKNSTATTLEVLTTLAVDTYVTLGFWWDSRLGVLTVYYNDNPVISTTTTTNFPDDQTLAVSFGILTGDDAAETMSVDYILVAKDRQAPRDRAAA